MKTRRPRHYPFHACPNRISYIFLSDSAIDLNGKMQSAFPFPLSKLGNLVKGIVNEFLAAELA